VSTCAAKALVMPQRIKNRKSIFFIVFIFS
jgi:hypothetical protein